MLPIRIVHSLLCVVVCLIVCASGYVKKSDINEFASAINGAGRLRYGKRSNWDSLYQEALWEAEDSANDVVNNYNQQYAKRAPMPSDILQNLKGAERLRFGRK